MSLFGDFEHHSHIFVGDHTPNGRLMFHWDIDQPLSNHHSSGLHPNIGDLPIFQDSQRRICDSLRPNSCDTWRSYLEEPAAGEFTLTAGDWDDDFGVPVSGGSRAVRQRPLAQSSPMFQCSPWRKYSFRIPKLTYEIWTMEHLRPFVVMCW